MGTKPSSFEYFENNEVSEMGFKSNTELIIELKKAIAEKNIGQTELLKIMEEHGHPIAKTTVQRLYKDGSEVNDSFRYKDTLQPLAEVLLGDKDDCFDPVEIARLQAEIKLKDETIAILNNQIDSLIAQIDQIHTEEAKQIEFLHNQIRLKDQRMDTKDVLIQRVMDRNDNKDRAIAELMEENKKLDESIRELLDRCRVCGKVK